MCDLLDDMAKITETLNSKTDHTFAESNHRSWVCGNLSNLGAFRFTMKLNTPMKEIDATEKKGLQAAIVKRMKEFGVQIEIDWAKGTSKVFTRFKLGMTADKHIECVVNAARCLLDQF